MSQIVDVKKLQKLGFNLMPLQKESKVPIAGVSWDHLKTNKYTGTFPDSCNVAVICGAVSDNLFVVDCDHKSLYDDFKEYHGKTRIIESGKGHHFYFRSIGFCPPSKKFNDKRLRHIDVKSDGGYVVSEDSIHPETKKPYKLICDAEPMRIDPKLIREKLEKLGFDVGGKSFDEIAEGIAEGGRDDGTFSYTCYLIRDKGLFGDALRHEVDILNSKHKPPLPESDIERIINSALKYEGKNIPKKIKEIKDFKKKEELNNRDPLKLGMQEINPRIHEGVPIEFNAMIIAVGDRQTYTKEAEYICAGCQEEGKPPRTVYCDDYHKIHAPFCFKHKKAFQIDIPTMVTAYIQQLRIQEFLEDARNSTPVQFDAEILDENVGEAYTSDRKSFVAKFRSIPTKSGYNNIVFEITKMSDIEQKDGCLPSPEELKEWKEHPDIFARVRESIAPELMINPRIIESLMLYGAGGHALNGKRSSIHMAMLGDAQLGKSDLLKRMHEILLGSGFTVGRNTTGAGLTISMVKMYNGTSVAQAGLLPQHTNHEVIIDEGDKMEPKDQNSILDCMEQETSSIAKSGAVGITLPAKCPILFAGNPKGGKYIERNKSVLDNFNMETPFISRFDLIWLMIDANDPELDKLIRSHIRNFRLRKDKYMKLDELQRYFNYIKTLTPEIPEEIEDKIDELHTKLRPLNKLDSLPIGIRQYHGIYRLITACAASHLREVVTLEDYEIVENILRDALKTMKMDLETGELEGSILPKKMTKEKAWLDTWNECMDDDGEVDKDIFVEALGKTENYNQLNAGVEFSKRLNAGHIELMNDTGLYKMVSH